MSELLFLILFLLLIAFLFRVDFVFYVAYVTLGVYLVSQWYTPRLLRGLRVRRHFQDHAFLGESIPVVIEISNASRLPIPWLQLAESVPVALRLGRPARSAMTVPGRESRRVFYEVRAMQRGYYRLGPTTLASGDLFGFKQSLSRVPEGYLTVYPAIIPLARTVLTSRLPFGTVASTQRLFEDPARPMGIRAYHAGDSFRHINWKVSAHRDNLLVRTFEPAISLESLLLLNLNRAEYPFRQRFDLPEWAIVVAASVAAFLSERRQAVGLGANGADPLRDNATGEALPAVFNRESGRLEMSIPTEGNSRSDMEQFPAARLVPDPIPVRSGRGHLMKLLELLARIEAAETVPFESWAPRCSVSLSWGVTIIAITPQADQATCQVLHRFLRSGFNPVLLVVDPFADFAASARRARGLGFPAHHIAKPEHLSAWAQAARWQPRKAS